MSIFGSQVPFRYWSKFGSVGSIFRYIGLLSGMRPGGWSVTVNERDRDAKVLFFHVFALSVFLF